MPPRLLLRMMTGRVAAALMTSRGQNVHRTLQPLRPDIYSHAPRRSAPRGRTSGTLSLSHLPFPCIPRHIRFYPPLHAPYPTRNHAPQLQEARVPRVRRHRARRVRRARRPSRAARTVRRDARHLSGTFSPQGAGITTLSVVLQAVAQRLENVFWNGSGWGIFWTDAVCISSTPR